jgi:iron complex transport system permease protein
LNNRFSKLVIILVATLLILLAIGSIFLGRYPNFPGLTLRRLMQDTIAQNLVFRLRFPRIICAILLGMCLSLAGYVMQMIFRNPLVEPGFLGVSQGAAFGAAIAILYVGYSPIIIEGSAILFAFIGLFLSYLISLNIHLNDSILSLILAGIAVTALFSAGVGLLKFLADPFKQLPELVFWLLGGLASTRWESVLYIFPIIFIGLLVIFLFRWRINIISLEDSVAKSLGANVRIEKAILLSAAVVITSAVISVAGIIGWVGLIIPHITRSLVGSNPRICMPIAVILGGMFTLICDDIARTLIAGEIPLGILTSLLGAVFFITILAFGKIKIRGRENE